MTDREAMQMALEALEFYYDLHAQKPDIKVITALRTALSRKALDELAEIDRELGLDYTQPDLAKVGEVGVWGEQEHKYWCASLTQMLASLPPKPAPCDCKPINSPPVAASDTSQQPVDETQERRHEPVAMRWDFNGDGYWYMDASNGSDWQTRVKGAEPLYTHPPTPVIDKSAAKRIATQLGWEPKRKWQGLTEEELRDLRKRNQQHDAFARAIEDKLKEKNHG